MDKKIEIISYTLTGIEILKDYFKKFEYLTGTYAHCRYEGLKDAEHLAKLYLIEQIKEDESHE